MSKLDEKIEMYGKSLKEKVGVTPDMDLLRLVTKGLGPSIYNRDAESVSCSDQSELDRVKKNYLMKKLGLADSPELDAAIKGVCEQMGSSNRNKYRAVFYYLLCQKFKMESIYA